MRDVPRTPPATLSRARRIALDHGLRYVYTGNVHDPDGQSTRCPGCGAGRGPADWYVIDGVRAWTTRSLRPLRHRRYPACYDGPAGSWGARRLPVLIGAHDRTCRYAPPAVAGPVLSGGPGGSWPIPSDTLLAAWPPPALTTALPAPGRTWSRMPVTSTPGRRRRMPTEAPGPAGCPHRTVVLRRPSHRYARCRPRPRGVTPLGTVPIDVAGGDALVSAGLAARHDSPHAAEHSLEVQVPFLQRTRPGACRCCRSRSGGPPRTRWRPCWRPAPAGAVVVCSTDLSHYLDEAAADAGRRPAGGVDPAAARSGPRACGVFAKIGAAVDACGRGYACCADSLRWAASDARAGRLRRLLGVARGSHRPASTDMRLLDGVNSLTSRPRCTSSAAHAAVDGDRLLPRSARGASGSVVRAWSPSEVLAGSVIAASSLC